MHKENSSYKPLSLTIIDSVNHMEIKKIQIFKAKNSEKNASWKCLSLIVIDSVNRVNKQKVLSSNRFGRMQIHNKK